MCNDVRLESESNWIVVESPRNVDAVNALRTLLDRGESEAIVLAEEHNANLLLIDERRGWKIATARSITCVGLLGVLAEAKHKRLIDECWTVLDEMIRNPDFGLATSFEIASCLV